MRSWSRDQTGIFKIMNYLFLNTNFYSTSERNYQTLARSKQKVVLAAMLEGKSMPSNMAANTNHTTLLKNQSAIKYLP